jgi:hypothetical protein
MARGRVTAAAAILLSLVLAGPAAASPVIDRAARCLERQPVCVDPAARDVLPPAAARELRAKIESAGASPIYVAVLPGRAVGDAPNVAPLIDELRSTLGRAGTYAVVAGRRFGAKSDFFRVSPLANEVAAAHRGDDPQALLDDFVDRVAAAQSSSSQSESDYSVNPLVPIAIVGALVLLMVGLVVGQGRARRRRETEQLEEVKRVARDDLVALGDDIRSLDLDIEMPSASEAAKDEYGRAVDLYKSAQDAFDTARRPQDLAPVGNAVEEGRYRVASARARLEGDEPPEHRPPCFFDPRHGPSARDVEWAPAGGVPRPVPACEADAQRVERGLDPSMREVDVGGRTVPYWNTPAYYSPWAGGLFGGFGGGAFLGGLLLGSVFAGGFGYDDAWASDWGGDGGDIGGGDFGGGDFGGGGGDFGGGGGDFGGGGF